MLETKGYDVVEKGIREHGTFGMGTRTKGHADLKDRIAVLLTGRSRAAMEAVMAHTMSKSLTGGSGWVSKEHSLCDTYLYCLRCMM